jgi:uncharacterized membrane protein YebE (DUF533 family)
MSLGKMLTKMAIGFAVAKCMQQVSKSGGIGKVMEGLSGAGGSMQAGSGSGGGLSDIMGQLGKGAQGGSAGGGLGDILGGLTGGGTGGAGGGLGDMLGGLTGGAKGGSGGGLADILGGLTNGGGAAAGGLGGLGGLLGGLATARGGNGGGLEGLLRQGNPVEEPEPEDTAGLMIRAMVMAAQSDGELDAGEQKKLMDVLGDDAGEAEIGFVRQAMQAPVDANAIASDTPKGLETQVYSMSVMSITPDNAKEANYLHQLAQSMGIAPQTVNEIHDNFGVPRLYS